MVHVAQTEPDKNGMIRSIVWQLGNTKSSETLRKQISKLVLLLVITKIEFQRRFDSLTREPFNFENVKKNIG